MPETEGKAREWRYGALTEIARREGFSFLVTGHTKSDRAETFLYHLARGAGTGGLASLTWRRSLTEDLLLVRPLLNVSRVETLTFCEARQLPIHPDRANEDLHYKRNRVRQELIPYLRTRLNPRIEEHLCQTAAILEAENDYLEEIARGIYEKAIDRENQRLDRSALRSLPLALQRRVIRRFLAQYLPASPNFAEIEAVVSLIDAPNRTRTSSLSGSISVQARDNWLELVG
jgi:tRNA(Ile)-lysidine synthase